MSMVGQFLSISFLWLFFLQLLFAAPIDSDDGTQATEIIPSSNTSWVGDFTYENNSFSDSNDPLSSFNVLGCDGVEKARLGNVVAAMRTAMPPAIKDLQNKNQNQLPFNAWFGLGAKTSSTNSFIQGILKDIREVSRVGVFHKPTLICASAHLAHDYPKLPRYFWNWCENRHLSTGDPVRAFTTYEGYRTVICPTFWDLPFKPSSPQCIPVTNENIWGGAPKNLILFQHYLLAHELIHTYLGRKRSLGWESDPEEVYTARDCMQLSATNRVKNPNNYQYYFASKSQA